MECSLECLPLRCAVLLCYLSFFCEDELLLINLSTCPLPLIITLLFPLPLRWLLPVPLWWPSRPGDNPFVSSVDYVFPEGDTFLDFLYFAALPPLPTDNLFFEEERFTFFFGLGGCKFSKLRSRLDCLFVIEL